MQKVKDIAKLVYKSPKVRLAAKGLGLAIVAVIGDYFGFGDTLTKLLAN